MDRSQFDVDEQEARLVRPGSPYELVQYFDEFGAGQRFKHCGGSLRDLVRRASHRGSSPFLVGPAGIHTYGEIIAQAQRLASDLEAQYNIKRGARVGIVCSNGPRWVISFLSVLCANATPILANISDAANCLHCLQLANPSFVIADRAHADFVTQSYDCCIYENAIGDDRPGGDYPVSSRAQRDITGPTVIGQPTGLIAFTSGSTSKPKAVFCTDQSVLTGLLNMLLAGSLANIQAGHNSRNDRSAPCSLVFSPLSHASGYVQLLLSMMTGGRLAINAEISRLTTTIRNHNVTTLAGLNTDQVFQLLAEDTVERRLEGVRSWNISGLPLRKGVTDAIMNQLPHVTLMTGYGLTETCGGISAIAGSQLLERVGSSGRLVPTAEVRIVDRQGSRLGDGLAGEILLRGPMMMAGYLGENGNLFGMNQGWFKTGDVGFLSSDRHLIILDRDNEIISFSSKIISSGEVERWVTEIGHVQDACLIDFFNAGRKKLGLAIVVKEITSERLLCIKADLANFLDISASAISILPLKQLPRTASGKVLRATLEEAFVGMQAI